MSAVIRSISGRDVPGEPLSRTTRPVSLNSGVSARSRKGSVARPITSITPTIAKAGRSEPTARERPRS